MYAVYDHVTLGAHTGYDVVRMVRGGVEVVDTFLGITTTENDMDGAKARAEARCDGLKAHSVSNAHAPR